MFTLYETDFLIAWNRDSYLFFIWIPHVITQFINYSIFSTKTCHVSSVIYHISIYAQVSFWSIWCLWPICHPVLMLLYFNYSLIIKLIHLTNKSPLTLFFSRASWLFLYFFFFHIHFGTIPSSSSKKSSLHSIYPEIQNNWHLHNIFPFS